MGKVTCLLVLWSAAACFAEAPTALAIRDARVVTVSGPAIEKATVVLRDGLIEAVGENLAIPGDAWIIDGAGLTVYPGLIDGLSTWGIPEARAAASSSAARQPGAPAPAPGTPPPPPAKGPEDRPSNTSWIRAADLVRPNDQRLTSARNAGFTTAVTFPARGIFAGQGAVVNLGGENAGEMVVSSPAGLYLHMEPGGFGGGFPSSPMGVIAYIRQVYLDAEYYRGASELYAKNPSGRQRPRYDRALEGVLEAPRVLLPVPRAVDIERMIRFSAELKAKTIFYGGHEAYRSAELLKNSRVPLLVSLKWPGRNKDADPNEPVPIQELERWENAPSTPAVLAKAGVLFAFYSDGIEKPLDVLKAVKRAIDAGLPPEAALRAMTLSAAEMYGVADLLGSIDKGKIANLLVTRGNLFEDKTTIEHVFVDGVKFQPVAETAAGEEPTSR